jgi:hypothetical protein
METGDGQGLMLAEVQRAGGKRMNALDYLVGLKKLT